MEEPETGMAKARKPSLYTLHLSALWVSAPDGYFPASNAN